MVLTYPCVNTFWDPIESVVSEQRWEFFFKGVEKPYQFLSENTYLKMLPQLGFEILSFESVPHITTLIGKKGFEEYVRGWNPYLLFLPKTFHDQFMEEIGARAVEMNPLQADGSHVHPGATFFMKLRINVQRS